MRECLVDDSSGVYVGWVSSICGWVGVRRGGLEGYIFCCDNLHYGFIYLFIYLFIFNPVCLFIIISLNAFDFGF